MCGASETETNVCVTVAHATGATQWKTPLDSSGPVLYAYSGVAVIVQTVYNASDELHVQLLSLSVATGEVLWNRTVDAGWYLGWGAGLVLVNTFTTPDSPAGIVALNASTGCTVWQAAFDGNWSGTDGSPDIFFAGPAVIVNFKLSHHYHALNLTSGAELWHAALADVSCPGWPGMVGAAPGTLLCAGQQSASLLNSSSGNVMWTIEGTQLCEGGSVVQVGNTPQLLFAAGGTPPNCTFMFAVDAASGRLLWEGRQDHCPLGVVSTTSEFLAVTYDYINLFNATTYDLQCQFATPLMVANQVQEAAVIDDILLLALLDGNSAMQAFWV